MAFSAADITRLYLTLSDLKNLALGGTFFTGPLRFARPPNFWGQYFNHHRYSFPKLGEVPVGQWGLSSAKPMRPRRKVEQGQIRSFKDE